MAYITIGPGGGRALSGHAHAGALLTATPVVTLKVVESQFTAVAVKSLNILLRRKSETQSLQGLQSKKPRGMRPC